MLVEIDMVSEEEEFDSSHDDEAPPEEFEMMDELDHLYMDEQLYLQSIFDL